LLLYHSHKHISYPIRTIARSAILNRHYTVIPRFIRGISLTSSGPSYRRGANKQRDDGCQASAPMMSFK
ncbi:hypothetical protein OZD68_00005, partial [Wolbachia endosymbiont of Drosophila bicornuta]